MICAMAILFVMALSCLPVSAQNHPLTVENDSISRGNDLTISLITCYPGSEIYELCGHSAIRVRGEGIDSIWNFGIFDFNQPNFVYRFVKGETDYKGASYPFKWFMPEYVQYGRRVVEQDLNLTPDEAKRLHSILQRAVLPQNAVYRYNYIKDNCSTRILKHVDSASTEKIYYPDSIHYGTFRNEMRAYHEGYPWYQFGIDLALGSGLDGKINSKEEMFVPVELMRQASEAHFADGRPLVKATRILNEGTPMAVLPATPWYLGPFFWAWILAFIIACVVAWNLFSGKLYLPVYVAWFTLTGLAGCLIAFLVFISEHEATAPNALIVWLNPLQLILAFSMMVKPLRLLAIALACFNILVVGVLLISSPFISQSFNPAFFPLMLSTLALSATYAILCNKSSYSRR